MHYYGKYVNLQLFYIASKKIESSKSGMFAQEIQFLVKIAFFAMHSFRQF